jgi:hypothetical protein
MSLCLYCSLISLCCVPSSTLLHKCGSRREMSIVKFMSVRVLFLGMLWTVLQAAWNVHIFAFRTFIFWNTTQRNMARDRRPHPFIYCDLKTSPYSCLWRPYLCLVDLGYKSIAFTYSCEYVIEISDEQMRPSRPCSSVRDRISDTRNTNVWNSTNNNFVSISTIILFRNTLYYWQYNTLFVQKYKQKFHGAVSLLRRYQFRSQSRNSPHFTEHGSSLPHSQKSNYRATWLRSLQV